MNLCEYNQRIGARVVEMHNMTTKYERSLIRAGYRRGSGDLYNCWVKPVTTLRQRITRLVPYVFVIVVGVTALLCVSV